MILECKSCQKKFLVPDNAITSSGRLVQCSSCGNKWTQFPIKEAVGKTKIISAKIKKEKIFNQTEKKKKKIKKKSGPSIYSKEYLEKKHGIKLDENKIKVSKTKNINNNSQSYFGFYGYLILFIFTLTLLIGIINLTKEILIFNFPFTEVYVEYLFENLKNFNTLFKDILGIY